MPKHVKEIMPLWPVREAQRAHWTWQRLRDVSRSRFGTTRELFLDMNADVGINIFTGMARFRRTDLKAEALRRRGSLHPRPERVIDPLFADSDFFDRRDVVQVKYEMVRRTRVEGQPVSQSAAAFGFSRPSFYQAQARLARGGLAALVPQKPGPRRSHKLDPAVMRFVQQLRSGDAAVSSRELARRVRERFGRTVHPRSVERALAREEKKRS
jgi:transposase